MEGVLEGTVVADRYRIDGVLGSGAMGTVYRATHTMLGQVVALKTMHQKYVQDPAYHKRFMREARVSTAIAHPNVVRVTDAGEWQGNLYLVMEFLEGRTMESILRDEAELVDLPRLLAWSTQLARALVAAHEADLVHRDLKPENLMILAESQGGERLVVVDFGLAFIEHREDAGRVTANNIVSGTPFYMSPEQSSSSMLLPSSDLYSFGCILYQLITGVLPFEDKVVARILAKHIFTPPTPPAQRAPGRLIHPVLAGLAMKMLEKDPLRRPSAHEVLDVLEVVAMRPEEVDVGRDAMSLLPRERRMGEPETHRLGESARFPGMSEISGMTEGELTHYISFYGLEAIPQDFYVSLGMAGWEVCPLDEARPPDLVVTLSHEPEFIALWQQRCAVIAVATRGDMEALKQLSRLGCDDIVSWPIQPQKLLKKIERALKSSERRLLKR